MRAKLTDVSVQRFKPGVYMDTKTPAFGIRVGKHKLTWLVVRGEGRVKARLGHYPAMSLSEARKRALVMLGSPINEKPQISFEEAKEAFLALPRWRFHSHRVLKSSLKHFTWKRNVEKITHEDVATAIEAIEAPSARAHALKDVRTFFNWLVPRYLPVSPCVGLKMEAQKSRDRILTNDELRAVWNACEGTYGIIVKLLILTGQRKTEIGRLRYDQVKGNALEFWPDETKNGRFHWLPLGAVARSLIPLEGVDSIFRSSSGEGVYNGYAYHHSLLLKASGTKDWTLHELRRSFVSMHAELKMCFGVQVWL